MSRLYALLAAEPSGDLQASALVEHIRQIDPGSQFVGFGGRHLRSVGVELLCDTSCWGSIGPSEVVSRLPRIAWDYYRFRRVLRRRAPDVTVMIDSPALFMRMAKYTRKHGMRTVYYFPPSAWSTNHNRMRSIAGRVDGVVCTFRRNYQTYQEANVPAQFFGHPMVDVVKKRPRAEVLADLGLKEGRYVALIPGSRLQEIRLMTPILLEAARLVRERHPEVQFLLPAASERVYGKLQDLVEKEPVQLFDGKAQEVLTVSELALMTSGSISLEAAYLDTPMVIGYRFNRFDAMLGRILTALGLLKIDRFALPNLVVDDDIVPELLQDGASPGAFAEKGNALLTEGSFVRTQMLDGLARVRESLGQPPVTLKVAEYLVEMAKGQP